MIRQWSDLKPFIEPEIYSHLQAKLEIQKTDASAWRDTCLQYFQKFSKKPIYTSP
jgi:alpha-glucuronidase